VRNERSFIKIYISDYHILFTVKPLPEPLALSTIVLIRDSFLLVGGINGGGDTIYINIPDLDDWNLLDVKLKSKKCTAVAITLERDVLELLN
jgi:hypothetical protein